MVRKMAPVLKPGRLAFRNVDEAPGDAIAAFAREEGLSVPVPAYESESAFCQITLQVHPALDGVGLTAAVATALTAENIPANVVAAHHHEHVFVPEAMADRALKTLKTLAAKEG